MPVISTTPIIKKDKDKETKDPKGKSFPIQECTASGCKFTCKYGKHMKEHLKNVHGIDQEKSLLDQTVDISASELNLTTTVSSQSSTDSEEAHFHGSMEQRPHSTLAMILDCPLEKKEMVSTPSTSSSSRKRKTSDNDAVVVDNDAKKERKDDETADIEPPDSPATAKRKQLLEEAKKTIEVEKAKNIKQQKDHILQLLDGSDSSGESPNISTIEPPTLLNDSINLLDETKMEEGAEKTINIDETVTESRLQEAIDNSSLDLNFTTQGMSAEQGDPSMISQDSDTNNLVKDIQQELDLRTRSLQDCMSDKDILTTQLAMEIKKKEVAENTIAKKNKELEDCLATITALQESVKNPAPPSTSVLTDEDMAKIKRLKDENDTLKKKAIMR